MDRSRMPWLQQAVARNRVGRLALRSFEQRGTALPHLRAGIVIAIVLQLLTLCSGQVQGASYRHDILPLEDAPAEAVPLPVLIGKFH